MGNEKEEVKGALNGAAFSSLVSDQTMIIRK